MNFTMRSAGRFRAPMISAVVLAVISAASAQAQAPGLNTVRWSAAPAGRVMPGRPFVAVLRVSFPAGWHIYSVTQPSGGPVPTRFFVPAGQPFSASGPLRAPRPERTFDPNFGIQVETYDSGARFAIPLVAAASAGKTTRAATVAVRSQACNDKFCLPPRTVRVDVPLVVAGN